MKWQGARNFNTQPKEYEWLKTPSSSAAQFIANKLAEREIEGVDLEECKKLLFAQSNLPPEAANDSTVQSYIEGINLSTIERSYALMIDEVLDAAEKNQIETFVRSSNWKTHTKLQKILNDSTVLDTLLLATCKDVKSNLFLKKIKQDIFAGPD